MKIDIRGFLIWTLAVPKFIFNPPPPLVGLRLYMNDRIISGLQSQSGSGGKEKISCPCP
jgi:hypothetical protein